MFDEWTQACIAGHGGKSIDSEAPEAEQQVPTTTCILVISNTPLCTKHAHKENEIVHNAIAVRSYCVSSLYMYSVAETSTK